MACESLNTLSHTVRGACESGATAPRLLAALRHQDTIVAAQRQVGSKTTEITAFIPLLNTVDIAGAVVTADQLHTQRGHAAYLTGRDELRHGEGLDVGLGAAGVPGVGSPVKK